MRNFEPAALGSYLALFLALRPLGNAGLWTALLGFLLARGALQGWRYRALADATFRASRARVRGDGGGGVTARVGWGGLEGRSPRRAGPRCAGGRSAAEFRVHRCSPKLDSSRAPTHNPNQPRAVCGFLSKRLGQDGRSCPAARVLRV